MFLCTFCHETLQAIDPFATRNRVKFFKDEAVGASQEYVNENSGNRDGHSVSDPEVELE